MVHRIFYWLRSRTLVVAATMVLVNILIVITNVVLRYLFNIGIVALQELEWWTYALIFLFGSVAAFGYDRHVKIDIISQRFSRALHRKVHIAGLLIFYLPFCMLLLPPSWQFFWNSFLSNERSSDPGGMPAVFVIKGMIFLSFLLLSAIGILDTVRMVKESRSEQ